MYKNMDIDSILIPACFEEHQPRMDKLNLCREFFKENGCLDRDIVIGQDDVLQDGYIGYIVLKENNIRTVSAKVCDPCRGTLVYGVHPGGDGKEYCWRIVNATQDKQNLEVGGRAIVRTRFGYKEIIVTKIEYGMHQKAPNGRFAKRVVRCMLR